MIKRLPLKTQKMQAALAKPTARPLSTINSQKPSVSYNKTKEEIKSWRNKVRLILFHKCVCAHMDEQHEKGAGACRMCDGKKFIRCSKFRPIDFLLVIDFSILLREENESETN